ncbi:META domain-containing protein [Roseobacteraceae bacterium NS-SX3]
MMPLLRPAAAWLALLLPLTACGDETVAGYGASGKVWKLAEIDGAGFPAAATLSFPQRGRIAGTAPCNNFSGAMTAPYPWFEAETLAVTRRACADLDAEAAFLAALQDMREAEVLGDVLILRNEAGREMLFKAGG